MQLPKLTRNDKLAIVGLVVLVILFAIPVYAPHGTCEVARAAYKCVLAKAVIIEHCQYWGEFKCDTKADVSLPQVEWYIGNLCKVHNNNHPDDKLDCSNLKAACNQAVGQTVCPTLGG
jgi:hypothetical protein